MKGLRGGNAPFEVTGGRHTECAYDGDITSLSETLPTWLVGGQMSFRVAS
jgi:hypothetical protein